MDSTSLFLGLFFGSVGMGYFVYGKKQGRWMALIAGITLCVIPYALSSPILLTVAGLVVAALPFVFRW